jgi:hypothetical protein
MNLRVRDLLCVQRLRCGNFGFYSSVANRIWQLSDDDVRICVTSDEDVTLKDVLYIGYLTISFQNSLHESQKSDQREM